MTRAPGGAEDAVMTTDDIPEREPDTIEGGGINGWIRPVMVLGLLAAAAGFVVVVLFLSAAFPPSARREAQRLRLEQDLAWCRMQEGRPLVVRDSYGDWIVKECRW